MFNTGWSFGRWYVEPMYVVTLVADDPVVSTSYSQHTMRKTLRLASDLLRGVPQAEVCVRRGGKMVAWLHTDFRGQLDDAELYSPVSSLVTPLNPNGRLFYHEPAMVTRGSSYDDAERSDCPGF